MLMIGGDGIICFTMNTNFMTFHISYAPIMGYTKNGDMLLKRLSKGGNVLAGDNN